MVYTLGMHLEIQRHEANTGSRLDWLTHRGQRAERRPQHWTLQRSLCRLLGNDELNHQLIALQLPKKAGDPAVFRLTGPKSHGKPWDERLGISSTFPSPAVRQKCGDPMGFPFHGKCWNLGFFPNWNGTRFCNSEILRNMKWLLMAQLYWLMQTACNWEEPPNWVFQSEFPGLSLSRTQLTAELTSTVLQESSKRMNWAQHQQNVIQCGGRHCWSDASSAEVTFTPCMFPFQCTYCSGSLFSTALEHTQLPGSLGSEVFTLQPVML